MEKIKTVIEAFIRKSDGAIYIRDPEDDDIWISKEAFGSHKGWSHWKTNLFLDFVNEGTFDVAFTEEARDLLSDFYKKQKQSEINRIKEYEHRSGECYHCRMLLHNCLCSHDD